MLRNYETPLGLPPLVHQIAILSLPDGFGKDRFARGPKPFDGRTDGCAKLRHLVVTGRQNTTQMNTFCVGFLL